LLDFAQFGTELDEVSKKRLERGALAVELLKQPQYVTYSFVDQALMLMLLKEDFLDPIGIRNVSTFVVQFVSYVKSVYKDLYQEIYESQDISDEVWEKLVLMAKEFSKLFVPPDKTAIK